MPRIARPIVAALLALAAACGGAPTTPDPSTTPSPTPPVTLGIVAGTVSHVTTGARVAAAQVTVGTKSSATDGNGAYKIGDLPLGSTTLRVSADGFHAHEQAITVEATTTIAVTLTPVDAPPPPPSVPTATVHGTVTSATTTLPIEDADIDLVVTAEQRFKTRTDALGKWQVSDVPIGVRAELRIDAAGHTSIAQPLDIETATVTTSAALTPVTVPPPPPPPPSAFSTLVRFVDAFSRGGIGGAVLTAQGLMAAASAGDGRTTVSAEASESAPRRVSISAPGFVTRETFLRVPGSEAEIDLIPDSFDLVAFTQMARYPGITRWTERPRLVIEKRVLSCTTRVHEDSSFGTQSFTQTDGAVNQLIADMEAAVAEMSGDQLSFAGVTVQEAGIATLVPLMTAGQITVARCSNLAVNNGGNTGYARWTYDNNGRLVAATVVLDYAYEEAEGQSARRYGIRAHELGHALGFQHVTATTSRMNSSGAFLMTAFDRLASWLAYRRDVGNRYPDVDQGGVSVNRHHHAGVAHCR